MLLIDIVTHNNKMTCKVLSKTWVYMSIPLIRYNQVSDSQFYFSLIQSLLQFTGYSLIFIIDK